MTKTAILIGLVSAFVSAVAFADDQVDSQFHEAVGNKVQHDHQVEMHSHPGHVHHGKSGNGNSQTYTGDASGSAASHPTQIQDLKKKHHRKNPPPPNTMKMRD